MHVRIDRLRDHVEAIAGFTSTPGQGSTRPSYSAEFRKAQDYMEAKARALGLEVRTDAIGNQRIRLAGPNAHAPAVMIGSHLDTVVNGGDFDGVLGVVCGLEVLQVLVEAGQVPARPIEVVSFVEEEGISFRCPLLGSKAVTGQLSEQDLSGLRTDDSRSFLDCARAYGLEPLRLHDELIRPTDVHAMLELHIEQGGVLEAEGLAVGIVHTIAGSENYRVRVYGCANHAGTTPMRLRRDALAAACEMVLAAEAVACSEPNADTVATVGSIRCAPNAANVIPGAVEFSIDIRELTSDRIAGAASNIIARLREIASRRQVQVEIELTAKSDPQALAPEIGDRIERAAAALGVAYRKMHSGALHDAAMIGRIADVGMIFVPSRNGISHSPEEWTDYSDIESGANVLLQVATELSGAERSHAGKGQP